MKNLKSLIGLILVLLVSLSVTSCNDDNDESLDQQWASVLNNHGTPYVFSDNGNCYGAGGGISKEDFEKMFIGHGWKHYATWEINKKGRRMSDGYYTNILGASPVNYYFDSNTKLTAYYHSDVAESTIKKEEIAYTFNEDTQRTVLLLDNNEYLQITGWMLGTQPSFCIVHPLGIKSNGETIYGVSIYVQMTDKELNTMQNSAK